MERQPRPVSSSENKWCVEIENLILCTMSINQSHQIAGDSQVSTSPGKFRPILDNLNFETITIQKRQSCHKSDFLSRLEQVV